MGRCGQTCENPPCTAQVSPNMMSRTQPQLAGASDTVLLQLVKNLGEAKEEFDKCMERSPEIKVLMCSVGNVKSVLVNMVCVRTDISLLHPDRKGRFQMHRSSSETHRGQFCRQNQKCRH